VKLTAFTCIVGQTDGLKVPTHVNPAVRYVVLSDRPHNVPPYEYVHIPGNGGARLLSRSIKILADHPALGQPDVLLWHDAAYRLDCDPMAVAAEALDGCELVAFRHPHRAQIEDEAFAIAKHGYVPLEQVQKQAAAYRAEGFVQWAITSTGFCLRRRTERVRAFNATWWAEVERWCWRDQMSVDFALWKAGLRPCYIPGHYRDNPHAKWFPS